MKVLVIGGMHGNEPLGLAVIQLLREKPIKGVDAIVANEEANAKNRRFVKKDLNRSFPGSISSLKYESRRAAELLKLCQDYDLVLDFHNTHCPNNDCSFIGKQAVDATYRLASWLGLRRVIVADYECINKYAANCLSIEISLSSLRMNARKWYRRIRELSQLNSLPPPSELELYKFVYRVTLADRDQLNLRSRKLQAFVAIGDDLATAMGVQPKAYPIFLGDGYTPDNYGGLLNKLNV